jgi:pyruvate dehydrogenase E2 component (dihydrolipoamide acetyltransferase)
MAEIQMPRLSDSMEEGTILKWLKSPGDAVARGEPLVEIETDKATMTYEADAAGALEILAAEGDTLPIGAVIARLGNGQGASTNAAARTPDAGAALSIAAASQPPAASAAVQGAPPVVAAPGRPVERALPDTHADEPLPGSAAQSTLGDRVRASPLARRIAREQRVDLAAITGSGPGGRVVRADVEHEAGREPGGPASATEVRATATARQGTVASSPERPVPRTRPTDGELQAGKGIVKSQEPTRAQQVIARRMASSKATVPEFTLNAEIDMERCVELRRRLQALPGERRVPSYNDLVVKACGLALREHPRANGAWRDGRFELFSRVNVGVAVAGEGVLVVPTIFDADIKPLEEIATETRRLAQRVRDGQVTPPELSGATFTVSNLGMFGVRSFTAVINPPQAAILAVGAVTQRALVIDGELAARHAMDVTLACDHRILYGADAARLLARLRELLEEPLALLR